MATITFATLSEVPEDLRENAKEGEDGRYSISVAARDRLTEFRENNVKLSRERDELIAAIMQYEGVTGVGLEDLSAGKLSDFNKTLETLRETKKRVDDGALVENTSLEEAAAARVTEVTNGFKVQLAEMAKDRDAQKERAHKAEEHSRQMLVENQIRIAARDPDVGMIDEAVGFVLPHAYQVFRVGEDGKIVPKDSGGAVIYGSDGVTPMSPKEWLLRQREQSAGFMFKNSQGGGAGGSKDTSTGRLSVAELSKLPPAERMNYARKNGL